MHPDQRSKGVGKLMTYYINTKAEEARCNMIALDAFTGNFKAHRFYYNQGYYPRGFHFKPLNMKMYIYKVIQHTVFKDIKTAFF